MRKIPKNANIGLCKTKWSLKNDITLEKSQKFSGKCFLIIGILNIIMALLASGMFSLIFMGVPVITGATIVIVYSYKVAQIYSYKVAQNMSYFLRFRYPHVKF